METFLAICVGLALSAAVGFRIFTPLLLTGLFVRIDWITLSEGFEWLGSTPALIAFGTATILEIAVNYIPIVASFMKLIATPLAALAGILLTASFIGDMSPLLEWSIAIIGGGGVATASHASVAAFKGVSETAFMGPAFSLGEDTAATVSPVLIFLFPFLAVVFILGMAVFIIRIYRKNRMRANPSG